MAGGLWHNFVAGCSVGEAVDRAVLTTSREFPTMVARNPQLSSAGFYHWRLASVAQKKSDADGFRWSAALVSGNRSVAASSPGHVLPVQNASTGHLGQNSPLRRKSQQQGNSLTSPIYRLL